MPVRSAGHAVPACQIMFFMAWRTPQTETGADDRWPSNSLTWSVRITPGRSVTATHWRAMRPPGASCPPSWLAWSSSRPPLTGPRRRRRHCRWRALLRRKPGSLGLEGHAQAFLPTAPCLSNFPAQDMMPEGSVVVVVVVVVVRGGSGGGGGGGGGVTSVPWLKQAASLRHR
jgi:hypothetical protein